MPRHRHEDVVRAIVRDAAAAVLDSRAAALADAPDAVHKHRTAVRRLRSVLSAFRGSLDEAAVQRLRVGYEQYGQELGVVRDLEVRAAFAADALRERDLEDHPAWRRLVAVEEADYSRAHARLVELAEQPRARAREQMLVDFALEPAVTDADASARKRLRPVLRREVTRVVRADGRRDDSLDSLHDLRKAGRRLRYVAEAVHHAAPDIFGDDVDDLAGAGEKVHDVLGDHRDLLIFAETVSLARARAAHDGESVQEYSEIIRSSSEAAAKRLTDLDDAVDRVRTAAVWLD